jgi:hypothetical protein
MIDVIYGVGGGAFVKYDKTVLRPVIALFTPPGRGKVAPNRCLWESYADFRLAAPSS